MGRVLLPVRNSPVMACFGAPVYPPLAVLGYLGGLFILILLLWLQALWFSQQRLGLLFLNRGALLLNLQQLSEPFRPSEGHSSSSTSSILILPLWTYGSSTLISFSSEGMRCASLWACERGGLICMHVRRELQYVCLYGRHNCLVAALADLVSLICHKLSL